METPSPNPNPTRIPDPEQSESPTKTFLKHNRCCFSFPCFNPTPSSPSLWDHIRAGESESRWWARPITAIKKLREWSEIVAGPKWKTFIRRFNRRNHYHYPPSSVPAGKFQYDPLSYALNFDEGGQFNDDDLGQFPDFSSRFAPVSSKSSMDLGRGGPTPLISV